MKKENGHLNMLIGDKYRITVLTDRLIRLEYSENGRFEDRASFAVTNRDFFFKDQITGHGGRNEENAAVTESLQVSDSENLLTIETKYLFLTYDKKEFSSLGLGIRLKDTGIVWNYGDNYTDWSNLGGTARTLDDADGKVSLEKGIFGKNGYACIDDSKTPVFEGEELVNRSEDAVDAYFFGYGRDYYNGLRDFCMLCGRMPMIPRYALGNWWSRYYRYTEDSYMDVVEHFAKEQIPISVAVIDMDWHITEVDPRYGSGWTGYSWNKDLFPDHKRFLKKLHDNKLSVTLNLHPADGIRPFEDMYEDVASAMRERTCGNKGEKSTESGTSGSCVNDVNTAGSTSDSCGSEYQNYENGVEFDFGNKTFRDVYFDKVMHPYEEDGVDFWWIDWQQGTGRKPTDVDPLLLLNHYHYMDQEKRNLRPMIFSRYAGVGSHRYPVGFSGDSHATWKSLEFQPFFTSTASNIAYGTWSHDIGGHMLGDKNDDRLIRWIEYGVFSPIMRIHSSCSPFFNKEPWLLDEPYRQIVKKFMRLRHELIPYLYTENHRAYEESKPLVRPMYYDYSEEMDDESYEVRNQYGFGDNLLVCAITSPDDDELRLGSTRALIPAGRWYDIFNGRIYDCDNNRVRKLYRNLSEIPVLLPAGGIVPMARLQDENNCKDSNGCENGEVPRRLLNDTGNPEKLRILVGGGASGSYKLYEDDGITMNFTDGASVETEISVAYDYESCTTSFTIAPAAGDLSLIPDKRSYEVIFFGVKTSGIRAVLGNEEKEIAVDFTFDGTRTTVTVPKTSVSEKVLITLKGIVLLENDYRKLVFEILDRAWIKTMDKELVFNKLNTLPKEHFACWLRTADVSENLKRALEEVL